MHKWNEIKQKCHEGLTVHTLLIEHVFFPIFFFLRTWRFWYSAEDKVKGCNYNSRWEAGADWAPSGAQLPKVSALNWCTSALCVGTAEILIRLSLGADRRVIGTALFQGHTRGADKKKKKNLKMNWKSIHPIDDKLKKIIKSYYCTTMHGCKWTEYLSGHLLIQRNSTSQMHCTVKNVSTVILRPVWTLNAVSPSHTAAHHPPPRPNDNSG